MKVKKCPESAQVVKQIASGSSIHASLPEKEPKITMTECLSFPRARKARHCVFFCSFRTLSDLEALPADSAKRPTQLVEIRKSVSAEIFPACPRVGVWLFLFLFLFYSLPPLPCLLPWLHSFFLLPPEAVRGCLCERSRASRQASTSDSLGEALN